MNDNSPQRAEDVLNMLITVYSENWVADKNQVNLFTFKFLNERMDVIKRELDDVDVNISSYKWANLVPNVQEASLMCMNNNNTTSDQP